MKVIVILGNRLLKDGNMSTKLINRLSAGIKHYRRGDKIILSGGRVEQRTKYSEAFKMREYILNNTSINPKDILDERISKTTVENAKYSHRIFINSIKNKLNTNRQNRTRIMVVSSLEHISRVKRIFEKEWGGKDKRYIYNLEYVAT